MNEPANPFQSPQTISDPPQTGSGPAATGKRIIPYASGHTRAMCTIWLLALGILTDLAGVGSGYMEINLLTRAQSGGLISPAEAESNDLRQGAVGLMQTAIYLASAVAFLMWFHRAHRNLPALGAWNLKYSPGWAVGSWFIPILNFFRPYQIMAEVSRESNPDAIRPGSLFPGEGRASPLLGWWWALWLIMNFAGQAAMRLSLRAESLELLKAASWTSVIADLISLPAALLAIMVVRGVDANQAERYQLLQQASGATGPASGDSRFAFPT